MANYTDDPNNYWNEIGEEESYREPLAKSPRRLGKSTANRQAMASVLQLRAQAAMKKQAQLDRIQSSLAYSGALGAHPGSGYVPYGDVADRLPPEWGRGEGGSLPMGVNLAQLQPEDYEYLGLMPRDKGTPVAGR